MEKRKACRMASRRGERKARQRLAVKHATFVAGRTLVRVLPGCEEPITCKLIKNTEARFLNRKRPKGWLTPRAVICAQKERTYKLDGKVVAKNRYKRMDQHEDSLHEFYLGLKRTRGKVEARKICSRLKVLKSTRSYNNPDRVMPGAEFFYQGERYVLRGQQNSGLYFLAEGSDKRLPSRECIITKRNTGLVFVS